MNDHECIERNVLQKLQENCLEVIFYENKTTAEDFNLCLYFQIFVTCLNESMIELHMLREHVEKDITCILTQFKEERIKYDVAWPYDYNDLDGPASVYNYLTFNDKCTNFKKVLKFLKELQNV